MAAKAARAAVSVRSIRGPRRTRWNPSSSAFRISASSSPPSGPISIRTAGAGVMSARCSDAVGSSTSCSGSADPSYANPVIL